MKNLNFNQLLYNIQLIISIIAYKIAYKNNYIWICKQFKNKKYYKYYKLNKKYYKK